MSNNTPMVVVPTEAEIAHYSRSTWSARDLIQLAKEHPPEPIIEGLLNVGDILLLHGTEESFKSIFVLQIAESIATGRPLLRQWKVRGTRRVGIIETEMHPAMLGERLGRMFRDDNAPEHMRFVGEEWLQEWRRQHLGGKFGLIEEWIGDERIDGLIIDTANDFFRGDNNPSEERDVGAFFDNLRNLRLQARIVVRHDRKKKDVDSLSHSNELIRGSAEWKEDPEAILYLRRLDKRTNEVQMEVGKLRYGTKPEPLELWFDAGCFRLVALPPVIAVLEPGRKTRQQVIAECYERFGLAERTVGYMLDGLQPFLRLTQDRHQRLYEIDCERIGDAPWGLVVRVPEHGG